MNKNSGKKTKKPQSAPNPAPAAASKKPGAGTKAPAGQRNKAAEPEPIRSTPFAPEAASPLSKEVQSPAPGPKLEPSTQAKASETKPAAAKAAKIKPGKRPLRTAQDPRAEIKVPSLLLEGDSPSSPQVSGPGARYALAPEAVTSTPLPASGELPEAYGTGRVFLAARDPHWLYVSWDFTSEQQNRYNAQSRDGHLVVKVFARGEQIALNPEVHVHPESRHWFLHVANAGTSYRVEIGFYETGGTWRSVAVSQNTFTPPDAPSTDLSAEFATIPADVTFQQVVAAVEQFVSVSEHKPLLEAVALAAEAQRQDSRTNPEGGLPREADVLGQSPERSPALKGGRLAEPLPIEITPAGEWSAEQRQALTRLIHVDSFRRVWLGSMEITELVRRQLEEEVASMAAAKRAGQGMESREFPGPSMSSPAGGEFPKPRQFWFKVNAELIIYGATEPDAKVTIADRLIKLRPDGTFSFRFSLPDGRYQLPVVAISSNGEDGREARLEFSRATMYRGEVEPHAQDAALHPPHGEHLR